MSVGRRHSVQLTKIIHTPVRSCVAPILEYLKNVQMNVAMANVCNTIKADSHIACRAHAATMPLHCHAVPLRVQNVSFPFDLHSAAVYDFHLPCHAHAAPMPCSDHSVLLKATTQHGRRGTACGLPARVRLLPATTRSSTKAVIRSITILLTTIHTYDCKEW
jgi:hypothetical protein